uniref:SLC26A/SulP transporter domain-containing protein n=1 Tax=Electrophorus electricus TaxID=8005 RepID=A0A4W4GQW2_ELEEL
MSASVAVYRNIYTEDRFRQAFGADDRPSAGEALRDQLAKRCRCSQVACLHLLNERVPVLKWLPKYKLRKWILGDIVAGLTVGIVHIPQGMAFALLTSVAPVYGLYTSFFPVILYMLFGTGHHVSTGTFAVISLMTGSVVEQLVPAPPALNSSSSEALVCGTDLLSPRPFCGFCPQLCMFGLQLGFLSTYLSEPIIKAFTSAAAFHVTVSQLQSMLGLRLPRYMGAFSLFKTLASVMENLPHTNLAALLISLLCLAVLVPVKEVNARFRQRLRTPIPVEILTVIIATGVAYASSLDSRYDVQIVGHIPAGFPPPRLPALQTVPDIAGDTVAITFVGYAVSVSLAMIYADKHGYAIQPNQELLAHGISNTVSSLFSCFPSSGTLATTNILDSAGGCTQLSGLFTSLVVLIVLLLIGPLFYFLPKAVLACINVTSLRQMFLQFQDLPELWRVSRIDFVSISRLYQESLILLPQCYEVPGVKILAYNGPIYYGNRSFFKADVNQLLGLTPERIRSHEKARKAREKREREAINTVVRHVPMHSFRLLCTCTHTNPPPPHTHTHTRFIQWQISCLYLFGIVAFFRKEE